VFNDDCLNVLREMPDNSVDSIVTDPPYGISFMAKKWDYDVPSVEVWKEALRVLKPGGHALIACGTRTQHRMVCNIEDAGFEIRDVVSWIYGSGFPKSLNISKAIDKAAGVEREVVGSKLGQAGYSLKENDTENHNRGAYGKFTDAKAECDITAPATDEAKQWDGWGTALKPACEFFTLCRKLLSEKTVAANVLKWGTGGINIDASRVGTEEITINRHEGQSNSLVESTKGKWSGKQEVVQGRFPANLIHDGSQEVLELFPETKSAGKARAGGWADQGGKGGLLGVGNHQGNGMRYGDSGGSAARFFYAAKVSAKERNEGLEHLPDHDWQGDGAAVPERENRPFNPSKNHHPTVKSIALMRYLCRLITPPGGTILDPWMGSGSTGKAAKLEGFDFIGMEQDADYFRIAQARCGVKEETFDEEGFWG